MSENKVTLRGHLVIRSTPSLTKKKKKKSKPPPRMEKRAGQSCLSSDGYNSCWNIQGSLLNYKAGSFILNYSLRRIEFNSCKALPNPVMENVCLCNTRLPPTRRGGGSAWLRALFCLNSSPKPPGPSFEERMHLPISTRSK